MPIVYVLTTLSCSIVLPGLSRRTGEPCRIVSTRQLILACDHAEAISLVGCLDPRGEVFRVAVRDIVGVQQRLIAYAENLSVDGRVIQTLEALAPASFRYDASGTPYTYGSLGAQDSVELIGAWPSQNGDITAQMLPVCGLLIPVADPLIPPFRQVGHLWPHGDFARPAGSEIVSFVRAPGVMFAARYPLELAARVIVRNVSMWGESWAPGEISAEAKETAADITRQFRPRRHTPLTHDILRSASERPPLEDAGDLRHDYAPTSPTARMIWHNGRTRSGVCLSADNWAVDKLFITPHEWDVESLGRLKLLGKGIINIHH
ncbi:MAG: hypothetical protein Q8O35_02450 [Humidesulfovibrio sp.]|uniref:hypothetical protein n=1 Tax=Humidesulfovibrio sp. TaxID=2910988 RepID=UPI0027341F23|nr:hypothetical protein [Humidesulfovibrio sp.]MDP2847035.1 hypothetical protein [Humidesulfovibrio sp.]